MALARGANEDAGAPQACSRGDKMNMCAEAAQRVVSIAELRAQYLALSGARRAAFLLSLAPQDRRELDQLAAGSSPASRAGRVRTRG